MKTIYILLSLCLGGKVFAQDTAAIFSRHGLDRGVHLMKDRSSNFIATGITTNEGRSADGLVLKYNSNLQLTWSRHYGGMGYDFLWGIAETNDRGYIIAGFTNSFGSGGFDCWILRLNEQGDTLWTRTLGGPADERALSVIEVSDGNFVAVGQTASWGKGDNDVLLFKISADGKILWHRVIGEVKSDRGFYIVEAANKDLIISGISENNSNNDIDALCLRTNADGQVVWKKTIGGKGVDVAHTLSLDGDHVVIGGYKEYKPGLHNPWVFRLNASGAVVATEIFDMPGDSRIIGGYVPTEGGFIATGYVKTTDSSKWDVFLFRLDAAGKSTVSKYALDADDHGYGICEFEKGVSIIVGHSYSTGSKDGDLIILKWKHN